MNFYKSIISALILASFMTGCRKDEGVATGGEEAYNIEVSLPDGPVAKTHLGERSGDIFPLLWSEGDRLSLNGTPSYPLSAEDAGGRSASFGFRGSIRAPYNVLYPATTEADKVNFLSIQKYTVDSFDPAALPMYASSGSYSDAEMHHLGTLLGFPFTGTGTALKQLIVMSIDGTVLSGTFTLETDADGAFTGSFAARDGASTATLVFPEGGLALDATPVTAWISVPSGEYSRGFTALVVDTDDHAMMLSFLTKETANHSLMPGCAILFPSTAFNPGAGLFIIDEPEDLVLLSQEPTTHPEVLLVKDLDMSGVNGWTPVEGFSGLFNGAGHCISGLGAAVFGTMDGEVRNLTVHASIESSATVIAGIANEVSASGRVVSCSVKGSIKYEGNSSEALYLGGIAAKCHGEIVSCTAAAAIEYASGATSGNSFLGGIAGYMTREAAIGMAGLEALPEASVTLNYPAEGTPQLRAGGLFGYITSPETTLKDCSNAGALMLTVTEGAANSRVWLGGIAGNITSSGDGAVKLLSCSNKGSITVDGKGKMGENSVYNRPFSVAGIVAKCQITGASVTSRILLENCENTGDITLASSHASSQIGYLAGICADAIAANIEDKQCTNSGNITVTGYTDRFAIAGHIGIVWRREGVKTTLSVTGKGETPVNTGKLAWHDGSKCTKHPVAGGVVGLLMAQDIVPLEFSIKNCSNAGVIDRITSATASFTIAPANEASAGGIVGNVGFQSSTDAYSYVSGTIENCSNSAQITINAFAGETIIVEKTVDQSFPGGILGFSHAKYGLVNVKDCSNSGYMQITAGNAGGIVGRIQSNTQVMHSLNTGRVGEFDLSYPTSYVSTGYSITGGIVGAMVYTDGNDVSKIEYCHNAGDISGCHRKSDDTGTILRPTVGGIIGRYDAGRSYAAVRYCKNSGHVRSYRAASSSSTWQYSGLISGSYSEDPVGSGVFAIVRDCGVGGFISRASWIIPTAGDGEYPFYNYIYCYQVLGGDYPVTTPEGTGFAEGCVVWDGISKLPWED